MATGLVSWEQLTRQQAFLEMDALFYSPFQPIALQDPKLECLNADALQWMGIDPHSVAESGIPLFSANQAFSSVLPIAHAYAGHQLGVFNPFLGDGRCVLLGELHTVQGWMEVSLKGVGRTVYARHADGRAGVTECVHEFNMSRTLYALGVPTVQCVCVISGLPTVYRGGFERAAVLTRFTPSHIRFGTFELYYFQRNLGALEQLAHYVQRRYFPECQASLGAWFEQVVIRTARLIAHWQAVGFVHGMMNTDNQSIVGVTLDTGSSQFNPERDPQFVASSQDKYKRYAFAQQPLIGLWNCNVLARALSPLIAAAELKTALQAYEPCYLDAYSGLTST